MMRILNKKLTKKGFTLAELLVVIAIIAILVAISIPIFTSRLDKARTATDLANERAAKAAAVTMYMTTDPQPENATYYYDIDKADATTTKPTKAYGESSDNKDKVVQIEIDSAGTATATWVAKGN